jgi:hypothetical protein
MSVKFILIGLIRISMMDFNLVDHSVGKLILRVNMMRAIISRFIMI